MNALPAFLLDSDVFIAAKNAYYAFDICPGFWKGLLRAHRIGRARSIDKVRSELLAGSKDEDLVQWVKKDLPGAFFAGSDTEAVSNAYTQVMLWVQRNPQFYDYAKAKFATGADGWLVAYSMVNGTLVVTNEQASPEAKGRIALPDVCAKFQVPYRHTFTMLRDLGIQFALTGGN